MVYFSTVISLQNSSVKSAFERHPDLSEQVSLTNSLFLEKSLPLILAKILELHITPLSPHSPKIPLESEWKEITFNLEESPFI